MLAGAQCETLWTWRPRRGALAGAAMSSNRTAWPVDTYESSQHEDFDQRPRPPIQFTVSLTVHWSVWWVSWGPILSVIFSGVLFKIASINQLTNPEGFIDWRPYKSSVHDLQCNAFTKTPCAGVATSPKLPKTNWTLNTLRNDQPNLVL